MDKRLCFRAGDIHAAHRILHHFVYSWAFASCKLVIKALPGPADLEKKLFKQLRKQINKQNKKNKPDKS